MPWTEELALYAMVYMVLLGTELGLRDGTQVSVTALTSKLEGKLIGRIIDVIARLALLFFVFMMFRYGCALVGKQIQTAQLSPVMKIPMYVLYLSLPVSFGLTFVTQLVMLVCKVFNIPMEAITDIDSFIDSMFRKKEADKK